MTDPPATASKDAEAIEIDLFCPGCGYDLRALTGGTCPECGIEVDLAKLRESSIPWVLGEGFFGKMWGFVRTCDRATFRPTRFCREVARPVSLLHGRWFRRIVVWVAWLTLLATAAVDWVLLIYMKGEADDWSDFFRDAGISQAGFYVSIALLVLLFLVGFTGLHLYALHPRALAVERQDRAVALGHYACAPLALLPVLLVLRVAGLLLAWVGDLPASWATDLGMTVWGVSWLLAPMLVLLMLRNTYVFAGRAAQRSGFAQAGLALLVPLLWLGWGMVVFAVLPAVAGLVYLFFITG